MPYRLPIDARRVLHVLVSISVLLCVASFATQIARIVFGHSRIFGLVHLLNVDAENNWPSWWSASLLLVSAVLLGLIAAAELRRRGRYRRHWFALSLIFAWLSFDEASEWHEGFIEPLQLALDPPPIFFFAWVIPGMGLVAVLALLYWGFMRALPRATARLFHLSALVFLTGALGVEMIGGWYYSRPGPPDLIYVAITHVEEILEMLGVSTFVYALLVHIRSEQLEILVRPAETDRVA
jgi:hypothetical protein